MTRLLLALDRLLDKFLMPGGLDTWLQDPQGRHRRPDREAGR